MLGMNFWPASASPVPFSMVESSPDPFKEAAWVPLAAGKGAIDGIGGGDNTSTDIAQVQEDELRVTVSLHQVTLLAGCLTPSNGRLRRLLRPNEPVPINQCVMIENV